MPLTDELDVTTRRAGELSIGRPLRIIQVEALALALSRSFDEALREHGPDVNALQAARLKRHVLHGLTEHARSEARRVKATTKSSFLRALDRAGARVLVERDRARTELAEIRRKTEELKTAFEAPSTEPAHGRQAVPDGGLEQVLREVFRRGRGRDRAKLEQEVIAAALCVSQARQQELVHEALSEYRHQVELLERRLTKLSAAQEETERVLRAVARAKSVDRGLPSIYREVQGLLADDPRFGAKRVLLDELFAVNLRRREREKQGRYHRAA